MMVGAFALHTAAIAQQVHCPDRHIRAKHPAYAQHTDPAQMRAITSGIGAVCLEISKQKRDPAPLRCRQKFGPKGLLRAGHLIGAQAQIVGFSVAVDTQRDTVPRRGVKGAATRHQIKPDLNKAAAVVPRHLAPGCTARAPSSLPSSSIAAVALRA